MVADADFLEWFHSEIARVADDRNVADHRAFPAWCLEYVFEIDPDAAFTQSDTLSQGDGGIDGWYYEEGSNFHLVQAKYPVSRDKVYDPGALESLFRGLALLKHPLDIEEGPYKAGLLDIATKLQEAGDNDGVGITLDFFVAARISDAAKDQLGVMAIDAGVEIQFFELENFFGIYMARELIEDLHGETVSFPLAHPDQHYDVSGGLGVAGVTGGLVATLDAKGTGEAIAGHVPKIFHRNVRYHLGASKKVNRRMEKTINDPQERDSFWLFNNGLTIVCDSFEVVTNGPAAVVATNPQIVNGAQTTSSLTNLRINYRAGDISVQARFVSTDSSEAGEEATRAISEFTNSQSAVGEADLTANDPRHIKIQNRFRGLIPPYFYERRRGEWNALDAATQARFTKKRLVRKDEIGQRWRAFAGNPASAVTAKEEMYKDHDVAAAIFDPGRSGHLYLLAYNIFEDFSTILNKGNRKRLEAHTGGWTEEQITSITRAKKLWAGHMTALTAGLLKEHYGDDQGDLSSERALELREMWEKEDSELSSFVITSALLATNSWLLRDVSGEAKSDLQDEATLANLKNHLDHVIVIQRGAKQAMPPLPSDEE